MNDQFRSDSIAYEVVFSEYLHVALAIGPMIQANLRKHHEVVHVAHECQQ